MFVLVATVLTLVVIMLAWRGMGNGPAPRSGEEAPEPPQRAPRRPVRSTAPDDDPEFLREIDRKLRGEDKSS